MRVSADFTSTSEGDKYEIIDANGDLVEGRQPPDISDDVMVEMYEDMVFSRHFDTRTISLQRQGRMGTYPPVAGHEAAQIGSGYAVDDDDWIFPSYRESAIPFVRNVSPEAILRYWKGNEEGNAALAAANIFPINIVIASQIPHAVGMAMAFEYRNDGDRAVLCHFGDGATSEGDFHEGLNFAGVFDAPSVFFCNNNQYAISVPRKHQTGSRTIAQKAVSYGFDGVRVDGMDPLAVYEVTREAITRAKHPDEGTPRPTLIESVQYRFGAHTTADDPSVYRDEAEVDHWKQRDPIKRYEAFLRKTGRLDDETIDAIQSRAEECMSDAVDAVESMDDINPAEMFEFVYAEQTPGLERQSEQLQHLRAVHGDDALLEE